MERILGRARSAAMAIAALGLAAAAGWQNWWQHHAPAPVSSEPQQVQATLDRLPLSFIENRGQLDSRVAYYVQGKHTAVYFTATGLTFSLSGDKPAVPAKGDTSAAPVERWTLKLDFLGAKPGVKPQGRAPHAGVVSYFKGAEANWKTGLPTFGEVVYLDLWPGIDLVYSGGMSQLKYHFLVKPGADPRDIRLAYRGATSLRVTDGGELRVETPVQTLRDAKPVAYQEIGGRRVPVTMDVALGATGPGDAPPFGFTIGVYDPSQPLVLDPTILVYAGYIGGDRLDEGRGIAVDSAGNAYIAGSTWSLPFTFPETVGPDLSRGGVGTGGSPPFDAFVAKVNTSGTALVYAGYIGGDGPDQGNDIAVDGAGNAYLTGFTRADGGFPVKVGPDLTYNGGVDAFVAKVNASGTALVYAGYIGGDLTDEGNGVAVDRAGNAYVAGSTKSTQATFPVKVGPDLTFNSASAEDRDAFVAKLNASGTALVYAGYIGGSRRDVGMDIAVDGSGAAYVTGSTNSLFGFPKKIGPDLTYNGGSNEGDAFVAKVGTTGADLLYSGFIGGTGSDAGYGIAVDSAGNAYVAGNTTSSETTFPVKVGPDLTYNGNMDCFVAKLNPSGDALIYAGYLGGNFGDDAKGIAVDGLGNAYVTGGTSSTAATFPLLDGPDLSFNGGIYDAYIAKIRPAGTGLVYAGYIGGNGIDWGEGIAVDGFGRAYVTGVTDSTQATFPEKVGPDLTFNGGEQDAFVAKIREIGIIVP